jgi:outer membrane protein
MRFLRTLGAAAALAALPALVPDLSPAAHAAELKVATVDFQRALNEVSEGEAVRNKLEGMYAQKKKAIQQMENELTKRQQELQSQAMVLSKEALATKQQELQQMAMTYQQTFQESDQEMQMAYGQAMEGLITKMRTISEEISKERGYQLVLEVTEGGVVYSSSELDITAELIKRYNGRYK